MKTLEVFSQDNFSVYITHSAFGKKRCLFTGGIKESYKVPIGKSQYLQYFFNKLAPQGGIYYRLFLSDGVV